MILVAIIILTIIPFYLLITNNARMFLEKDYYNESVNSLKLLNSQTQILADTLDSISSTEGFDRISLITGEIQQRDYIAMINAQESLCNITGGNSLITDIIVTFKNNSIVLSRYNIFDNYDSFKKYYDIENLEEQIVAKQETDSSFTKTVTYYPKTQLSTPSFLSAGVIPILIPLRGDTNKTKVYGDIYIFLDEQQVIDMLVPSFLAQEGFFRLYSEGGNEILSYGLVDDEINLLELSNFETALINNKKHSIISVSDENGQLRLLIGVQFTQLYQGITDILLLIILYVLIAVILGTAVSIFQAYKMTKPLNNLLLELNSAGFDSPSSKNIFYFINKSIHDMNIEKTSIEEQVSRFKEIHYINWIDRIFSGNYNASEDDGTYKFPSKYILAYGEITKDIERDTDAYASLHLIITRYLKSQLPDNNITHSINNKSLVLVIPVEDETEIDISKLHLKDTIKNCNEIFNTDFSLAISYTSAGASHAFEVLEKIKASYYSCQNTNEIILYDKESIDHSESIDLKFLLNLYHKLLSGDYEAVESYILQIFHSQDVQENGMEQLYYITRMVILMAAKRLTGRVKPDFMPVYHSSFSPEHSVEILCDVSKQLCDEINRCKKSHNSELKDEILKYIDLNFQDSKLYGKSIADHFNISEKYLYSFMREQTGKTVGDILQNKRMVYVEYLLKNTNKPINEIYDSAGFNTHNTFYKAVKRVYGESPSKIRNNAKKM